MEALREVGGVGGAANRPQHTMTTAQQQPLSRTYREALQPRSGASSDIVASSKGVVGLQRSAVVSVIAQAREEGGSIDVGLFEERE